MTALTFDLPPRLEAHEPPEASGRPRDAVRLMVASRADGRIEHARFRDLPAHLRPGDLLIVNTSATLPAAIGARRADGTRVEVHVSTADPDDPRPQRWIVELRRADGSGPLFDGRAGERLRLDGDATLDLLTRSTPNGRLWHAQLAPGATLAAVLARSGRPIRYSYVPGRWPLSYYQTAFAADAGSAEMPSAGRPFTAELVTRLIAMGVVVAPVLLHAGVSSPGSDEPPYAERYVVPATTARLVNAAREWGGRVIAVGTTAVRALETVTDDDGTVAPGDGWTDLIISPERGVRAVDGLISGWHEPEASHLRMLEAVAGRALLARCYAAALEHGYLWHEFGDSHLILP